MPPTPPDEPNTLVLFAICLAGAFGLIGLLKLNHWWATRHTRRHHYVAPADSRHPAVADTSAVHVPVPRTDTGARTTPPALDITNDTNPAPRIGRRLRDDEIIAMLALQKGEDGGKYRFSANQIYELVKGPRAEVLDQIRALRDGPPAPQVREHQARLVQLQAANGIQES
jgi:hypothetical protein